MVLVPRKSTILHLVLFFHWFFFLYTFNMSLDLIPPIFYVNTIQSQYIKVQCNKLQFSAHFSGACLKLLPKKAVSCCDDSSLVYQEASTEIGVRTNRWLQMGLRGNLFIETASLCQEGKLNIYQ